MDAITTAHRAELFAGNAITHTDRGSQHHSLAHRNTLRRLEIRQSTSRLQSAGITASLTALDESIDWDRGDDLPIYGPMALEYGKRLWATTEEWAAWARKQVPDDES